MNKYNYKKSIKLVAVLNVLIDSSFQGVNRLFALSFEDNDDWKSYKQCYIPTVEIKGYNIAIDGRHFFDHSIKKFKSIW